LCTVVVLRQPGATWPLLLAANRDEKQDRAWDAPAAHWPDHPGVIAGRDRLAGGTWMALNQQGVVCAILNRVGTLGPASDKRSRGDLPLLATRHPSAAAAAAAIAALPAGAWRGFNMVLADARDAWFIRGLGHGRPELVPLPPGISMVTAHDPNDVSSPRTARHLPRFQAAAPPAPDRDDWAAWQALLGDDSVAESRADTLCVPPVGGFATVSASLVGLAADGRRCWRFAHGPPNRTAFAPLDLPLAL
jgi:hypothetical protein